MGNVIISAIIIGIVSLSIWKIISEKKQGNKCIGCPHGKSCSSSKQCGITLEIKK